MSGSELVARALGPFMIVMGVALLTSPRRAAQMAREMRDGALLLFLVGLFALTIGLVIVTIHNIWTAGWPVLITIFGWAAVIGGALRMSMPRLAARAISAAVNRPARARLAASGWLIYGLALSYFGFAA